MVRGIAVLNHVEVFLLVFLFALVVFVYLTQIEDGASPLGGRGAMINRGFQKGEFDAPLMNTCSPEVEGLSVFQVATCSHRMST